MKKSYSLLFLIAAFTFIPAFNPVLAATGHYKAHNNMKKSPATIEFEKAMDKMHKPMMAGIMDPDTDIAFVKGMIPHHQGAIDMARIELKYGEDAELRQLAEKIIANQEDEIKYMEAWLAKHKPN